MSKTTETSNLEHHDTPLADSELASVSGGLVVPSIIGILVGPGSTGPYTSVKEPAPAKHWFKIRTPDALWSGWRMIHEH